MGISTVVLVHGAWHGGWAWARVRPLLEAGGLRVHAPTLSGLGERAHLVSPTIGLRTHVDDIDAFLRWNDLSEVLLVGHSYGGLVVREAADRAPDRVRAIALLDAWVGNDGDSFNSLAPTWMTDAFGTSASEAGFGWLCPPPPTGAFGVTDPADVAWLEAHLTPQPIATFSDRTRLTGRVNDIPHHAAVCASGFDLPFKEMAAEVGCADIRHICSGHDAMVTAPEDVAAFITRACR